MSTTTPIPTEVLTSKSANEYYAAFINNLSTKRLHSYIFHWLTHLKNQPPEHKKLFFEYLFQPEHRWVYQHPHLKTPCFVKILEVREATSTETGPRPTAVPRPSTFPVLAWTVQLAEGTTHSFCTATSSTEGPFLSTPSLLNIPPFLLRSLSTASLTPTSTSPPHSLVLSPVFNSIQEHFPPLNIGDWQARVSLHPTYAKRTKTDHSGFAHISYYHPEHGYLPRYSHPISTPYYTRTETETFAIFQSIQHAVSSLLTHSFGVLDLLKTAFGSLSTAPTLKIPPKSSPLIPIVFQSAYNPDLRLSLHMELRLREPAHAHTSEINFRVIEQTPTHPSHQCVAGNNISPETHTYLSTVIQHVLPLFEEACSQTLTC